MPLQGASTRLRATLHSVFGRVLRRVTVAAHGRRAFVMEHAPQTGKHTVPNWSQTEASDSKQPFQGANPLGTGLADCGGLSRS